MASMKVVLISTGVVSLAIATHLSLPLLVHFALYMVPQIYYTVLSWLKPPYLYVVINGIIITIAATSHFLKSEDREEGVAQSQPSVHPQTMDLLVPEPNRVMIHQPLVSVSEVHHPQPLDGESAVLGSKQVVEDEFVVSKSEWIPPPRTEIVSWEKPLVSSRFSGRKTPKASPEGARALRVAKPKRQETLEMTWKSMTGGHHVPLTRHLKKSDTWSRDTSPSSPVAMVKKSETFKDGVVNSPPSSSPKSGRLRKEASIGQDELNRRVEAFIKKFNEDMRLQRQESLNQYMEMINRGAH